MLGAELACDFRREQLWGSQNLHSLPEPTTNLSNREVNPTLALSIADTQDYKLLTRRKIIRNTSADLKQSRNLASHRTNVFQICQHSAYQQ